ncbi:MAG: hypothetical protein JNM83_12230 [Myxococcales bacterium]|nr:hypothetical protein [Myxococcales bacterium]
MAQIQTLEALAAALRTKLPEQRDFYVVNTRLILQTGVNLRRIRTEQNQSVVLIQAVLDALARMGVVIGGKSP